MSAESAHLLANDILVHVCVGCRHSRFVTHDICTCVCIHVRGLRTYAQLCNEDGCCVQTLTRVTSGAPARRSATAPALPLIVSVTQTMSYMTTDDLVSIKVRKMLREPVHDVHVLYCTCTLCTPKPSRPLTRWIALV